ncbi:vesicle-associated membrane protein 5 [Pholidichthys leucotaenia]
MENGKNRLQQTQEEVEEVKMVMITNMAKANERSEKLSDLEDRADDLMEQGRKFEKTTAKVKQKMLWQHKRMKVLLISIGVVVGLIILGLIIYYAVPK